jgi:dipeptidyl aminopeptidase/acylaminoacyl peptidase
LTVDPGDEIDPTFAPDNETIAYASDRSGDYEIYLQKASGGPAVNLTESEGDDVQPSFSPDGQSIAFVSTRQSRHPLATPGCARGGDVGNPALGGVPRRVAEDGFQRGRPTGERYYLSGAWFRSGSGVSPGGSAPETVPIRLPRRAHSVSPEPPSRLTDAGSRSVAPPPSGSTSSRRRAAKRGGSPRVPIPSSPRRAHRWST